jgi:hypothetical protein
MTTGTAISIEEYLRTNYDPDCEYVDGQVVERNLGEFEHSSTQREILFYLQTHYPDLRKKLLPEQRVQVRRDRFRVPDVCLLAEEAPRERIILPPRVSVLKFSRPRTPRAAPFGKSKTISTWAYLHAGSSTRLHGRAGSPHPAK